MIDEQLQEAAAAYAAGSMPQADREAFEMLIVYHTELRSLVHRLQDTATSAVLASTPARQAPAGLKSRIFAAIAQRPQQRMHEAIVVCGPDATVEWVSPEFSELCGYSLEEVRGRSLGPMLQGEGTEKDAAACMRAAVRGRTPCRTVMTNYHKNGTAYRVDIDLRPIFKEDGTLRCYVAREVEVAA